MNPSKPPPEGIVCHFCGKRFGTDQDLKEHVHNREKEQVCCVCDRTFLSKYYIERHMRIHTTELLGICYVCNKKCHSKTHLDIHMEIHTGARPHRCDVCNRRFARKKDLCRHRPVHREEKRSVCDICGKRFARKDILNRHFQTCSRKNQISGETSSEDSDGTAIHDTSLRSVDPAGIGSSVGTSSKPTHKNYAKYSKERHRRVHTRELLGICNVCNKQFRSKRHLDVHMRVHTGEPPFGCDVCGRRFTHSTNLSRHRRIHTGEKPYVCDICGRRFARKDDLVRHFQSCSRRNQNSGGKSPEDNLPCDRTAINHTSRRSVDPTGIDSSDLSSSKFARKNREPSYTNEDLTDVGESLFHRGRELAEVARDPKPSEPEEYEDCRSGSDCVPSDINGALHKSRDLSSLLTSPEDGAGDRETSSFPESGMSPLLRVGEPSTSMNEGASLIGNTSDPSRVDPVASDIVPVKQSDTGVAVDDGISDVLLKCENCGVFFSDLLSYALHSIEH